MMNILINAYAVSPSWGSEPGMGWNWVINIAQYCNVHVITEGEWKKEIETALHDLPYKENIHFYYLPVSEKIRKMCWNQGDWRFYYYYRKWQKKALKTAKSIIEHNQIDVIHQLNMIGFREPGYLWKIKEIPFVWGPIGGMELIPISFLEGESLKFKLGTLLKNFLNDQQRKYQSNVLKALVRADALLAATKNVYKFIKNYHHKNVILLNETGCYEHELINRTYSKETFDIIWVGKFDFRKQAHLALKALALLKDFKNIKLHMIGTGTNTELIRLKKMANNFEVNDMVKWYGKIPNERVHQLMREGDVFLFTSIMEGTPHVVLEAIQNSLPVICFDSCGQADVVTNNIGIKIPQLDRTHAALEFSKALLKLYGNRDTLRQMSLNCLQRQKELSWNSKAMTMINVYRQVIANYNRNYA